MKKLLIATIIVILLIFGYNKYQDYIRFNGPETTYIQKSNVDINYYDKNILFSYLNDISQLNSFIKTQWSVHKIDVLNPEDEDTETKLAINDYSKKLAQIKYYENLLEQSTRLKKQGLNNNDIRFIEQKGISEEKYLDLQKKERYNQALRESFNKQDIQLYNKTPIIFEVQKLLTKKGIPLAIDGIYKIETIEALKKFEAKKNLLVDGKLDLITLEFLLESN